MELTGLDWYPNPGKVAQNELWQEAVEIVDSIIAAQAEALGIAHRAAENDRESELAPEAAVIASEFVEWVAEVKKLAMA